MQNILLMQMKKSYICFVMNYLLSINKKLMNFFVYLTYKFVLISKINLKFKILILSKI